MTGQYTMKPMNRSKFYLAKLLEFKILEYIWCIDKPVEIVYYEEKFVLRYMKTGTFEKLDDGLILDEYFLLVMKVL